MLDLTSIACSETYNIFHLSSVTFLECCISFDMSSVTFLGALKACDLSSITIPERLTYFTVVSHIRRDAYNAWLSSVTTFRRAQNIRFLVSHIPRNTYNITHQLMSVTISETLKIMGLAVGHFSRNAYDVPLVVSHSFTKVI